MTTCKKCDNQGAVLLRKKDTYCENCFLVNINHKFRACIGKNKIFSRNENILVCVSGGPGSTALMQLVHDGISLENHKKLWITPVFFHIMGQQNGFDDNLLAKEIIEQCNLYNFNLHVAHISEYLLKRKDCFEDFLKLDCDTKKEFEELVQCMPNSSRNDFLLKATRDLFIRYGKKLQCKYIFTAETSETLAVNLLSNLSNGRGAQVMHDIGFCDNRDDIQILRPMRDISQEELQYYIKIMKLVPRSRNPNINENSIQAVIKHFVADLQENFQSTISTVCKTADKIGIQQAVVNQNMCKLCESGAGKQVSLSALEATEYSRNVSIGLKSKTDNNGEKGVSMFPYVNKYFCYTCSRHISEMEHSKLPQRIKEMLNEEFLP